MKRPAWQASVELWEIDGSLRDVYVRGVSISDWHALIKLAESYGYSHSIDGEPTSNPNIERIFSAQGLAILLSINVGAMAVNCHFFDSQEIELDIDPREVKGTQEHESILEFIERLGQALKKVVVVTPESLAEKPLLSYDPNLNEWIKHG